MNEGMTYKEKYTSLVNKIKETIKNKEESVILANKVINDNNLITSSVEVEESLLTAINENEVTINELYKLLEYTNSNL